MTDYRTRNQLVLARAEATLGVEETLTGSDAIRVRLPVEYATAPNVLETNYAQSSIDESAPLVGPGLSTLRCGTILQGSGTAGTPPGIAPLLRACGMAQDITATAVTGTAAAGTATTLTLAATASTVVDIYKGMVLRITAGTGNGQQRVITAYSAARVATVFPAWAVTPDGTSQYSIDINVRYRLATTGIPGVTIWAMFLSSLGGGQAIRRRLIGARGSAQFTLSPRGFPEIQFSFQGRAPGNPDLFTPPASPTFQPEAAAPFVQADCFVGAPGATATNARMLMSSLSFDIANELSNFDDPAAADGYTHTEIIRRVPGGTIAPNMLKTPRDLFAAMLAGTDMHMWINWGSTAGRRVSMFFPLNRFTAHQETDVRGYVAEQATFRTHGIDDALWVTLW